MIILRCLYAIIVGIICIPYWIVWSICGGHDAGLFGIRILKLWVKYGEKYLDYIEEL